MVAHPSGFKCVHETEIVTLYLEAFISAVIFAYTLKKLQTLNVGTLKLQPF
jgi:hypothetical protein